MTAVSRREARKDTEEQGQNSKGCSGGPNVKMFDMDSHKIGVIKPLNRYKWLASQQVGKVLVVIIDHKTNVFQTPCHYSWLRD